MKFKSGNKVKLKKYDFFKNGIVKHVEKSKDDLNQLVFVKAHENYSHLFIFKESELELVYENLNSIW